MGGPCAGVSAHARPDGAASGGGGGKLPGQDSNLDKESQNWLPEKVAAHFSCCKDSVYKHFQSAGSTGPYLLIAHSTLFWTPVTVQIAVQKCHVGITRRVPAVRSSGT